MSDHVRVWEDLKERNHNHRMCNIGISTDVVDDACSKETNQVLLLLLLLKWIYEVEHKGVNSIKQVLWNICHYCDSRELLFQKIHKRWRKYWASCVRKDLWERKIIKGICGTKSWDWNWNNMWIWVSMSVRKIQIRSGDHICHYYDSRELLYREL